MDSSRSSGGPENPELERAAAETIVGGEAGFARPEFELRLVADGRDVEQGQIGELRGDRIDPVELTAFLVDRLPYFMVPRYLEFATELPKTPAQKVHKHMLRDTGSQGAWDREAAGIVLRRGSR